MARRVLLVDDELDIVYPVKVGLERKGFEVDSYIRSNISTAEFQKGNISVINFRH